MAEIGNLIGPSEAYLSKISNEFKISDSFYSPESLVRFIDKKPLKKNIPNKIKLNEANLYYYDL